MSPITRAVLPRISSVTSGFFFWGIMLEPVEKRSESSMNLNSQLHHMIISSEKRERCIMQIEMALASSMQKSRSETPSREFAIGASMPSNSAVLPRLMW